MKVSYKTYRDCPNPPEGVNPDWVWQMAYAEIAGWTQVELTEYESYIAGFSEAISVWDAYRIEHLAMATVRDTILTPAMKFGEEVIKEFAAENIAMGITQDGMTARVREVTTDTMDALSTGSLYDAIDAAKNISILAYDLKYITAERLLYYVNKVETYLELPLSDHL